MKRRVKVSSPGKIILSGEHSVVYGYPALLAAVDLRVEVGIAGRKDKFEVKPDGFRHSLVVEGLKAVEKKLKQKMPRNLLLESDSKVPVGCGMGSSAAAAVSFAGAILQHIGQDWNLARINEIAYEIEKKHHGNPSGGDNAISTYGGFLWYRKEAENLKLFSQVNIKKRLPRLFLINTGKPKETTKDMVSFVADSYKARPKKIEKTLRNIQEITKSFLRLLLKEESASLIELIGDNQRLLELLGVVSTSTRQLVRKIEGVGGSAKVSGAGGKAGDSGILLVYHPNPIRLMSFVKSQKLDFFSVKLGEEGVRVEKEN